MLYRFAAQYRREQRVGGERMPWAPSLPFNFKPNGNQRSERVLSAYQAAADVTSSPCYDLFSQTDASRRSKALKVVEIDRDDHAGLGWDICQRTVPPTL